MMVFPIAILKAFIVLEKGNANCLPLNMSFLGSKITFFDFRFLGFFHSLVCLHPLVGSVFITSNQKAYLYSRVHACSATSKDLY